MLGVFLYPFLRRKVYTHTFSEEREKVDDVIDNYFEKTLGIKNTDIDLKKYKA